MKAFVVRRIWPLLFVSVMSCTSETTLDGLLSDAKALTVQRVSLLTLMERVKQLAEQDSQAH